MAKKKTEENTPSNPMDAFRSSLVSYLGKQATDIIIEDPENIVLERFPTGSLLLDRDLNGGWVKGTMVEIMGPSGSSKTTLCIHAAAEHQKKYPNEPILWLDLEKVFDPTYFKNIGINLDPDKFILMRPSAGEDVWEAIIRFVKSFDNGMVVLDSIALLLPKREDEGLVGDAQMASAARMNSQGLRKLFPYIKMGGTTIFAVNQYRSNIGNPYGPSNTTSGGNAWEYYSRTRIATSRSKGESGEYSNNKYTQVKSNYGHQDYVTETTVEYGVGFNRDKELLRLAVDEGIIVRGGSWYSYGDTKLGQGEDNVVELIRDNPELQQEIFDKLKASDVL